MRVAVALALAAVAALGGPAHADDREEVEEEWPPPPRPRFGVRAGANFAHVSGNLARRLDDRTGYVLGGFVVAPMPFEISRWKLRFAVDAGLAYSQKGGAATDDTSRLSLEYLQLPVVFVMSVRTSSTARARLALGLNVDINVDASLDGTTSSEDRMRTTQDLDLGVLAGAGLELETGYGVILVEMRYEIGVTDVDTTETDATHRVLSTTVGFAY